MVVVVLALLSTCVACSTKKASTNDTPSDAGTSDRVDEADGSTTADQRAQDATESDASQSVDARYPVAKHLLFQKEPLYVPNAVHLTWENEVSSTMVVQWKTTGNEIESHTPKVLINTKAEYLANGEQMLWSEAATTVGLGKTWQVELAGIPIDPELFAQYEVELTGLDPYTEYVYMAGFWDGFDTQTGLFTDATISGVSEFRTGRVKGDNGKVRFVMAGDSRGGTAEIAENIDRLAAIDVDMWFFNGDMTQGGTQPEWDTWFNAMGPLISKRVLMPVQGNHEIFPSPYYEQYALPIAGPELPDDLKEHAWSIDYGNVHFIGLDSNAPSLMDEQLAWLDSDLQQAADDPEIEWIIALFHHAAYSACTRHGSTGRVQDKFVPLFDKHGVDFVFTGHDHNYERTVPIRNDAKAEEGEGTVYVVAGGFYSPGYTNGSDWWTVISHHGDVRNFVVMEIEGKTAKLTAYDGKGGPGTTVEGNELDTYTLTKP